MSEMITFLFAPFVLAILLVGIHAYLGLHVLQRDVIFVDISLSQVAALGGALSLFFADSDDGTLCVLFSLVLCLFVALGLSLLRRFERKISQEAIIGITYALAGGALILAVDRLPHGGEQLKTALVGNILFVTWPQVLQTALVYLAVGIIHFIFRRRFWAISRGQEKSVLWDFIFYFLFGVVITFSTHHAGVLVVFSILVVPAALACRYVNDVMPRLMLAWGLGLAGVALAFLLSVRYDLPAGAAIVSTLTGCFFVILGGSLVLERLTAKS